MPRKRNSLGSRANRPDLAKTFGLLSPKRQELFRPVLPMLASTAPSVADALEANGPSAVEWKLDGARIQAHRQGDDVRLFTAYTGAGSPRFYLALSPELPNSGYAQFVVMTRDFSS